MATRTEPTIRAHFACAKDTLPRRISQMGTRKNPQNAHGGKIILANIKELQDEPVPELEFLRVLKCQQSLNYRFPNPASNGLKTTRELLGAIGSGMKKPLNHVKIGNVSS